MVGKQQVDSIGRAMTGAWTAFLVASVNAASVVVEAPHMEAADRWIWFVLVLWTVFWGTVYWYAANWEGRWFLEYPPKALGPLQMIWPVILMISFTGMPVIIASVAIKFPVRGMTYFLAFCIANQLIDLFGRRITRNLFLETNSTHHVTRALPSRPRVCVRRGRRMERATNLTRLPGRSREMAERDNFTRYLFHGQHIRRPTVKALFLLVALALQLVVAWKLVTWRHVVDVCIVILLVVMTLITELYVWSLRGRVERLDTLEEPEDLRKAVASRG